MLQLVLVIKPKQYLSEIFEITVHKASVIFND